MASEMKGRTAKSARNAVFGVGSYFITLILQMINRTVFVHVLATEYLGLNGLFSNILSLLSLSELGVGTAITYALYRPIAEKNYEKIKSIMQLFKRVYEVIGCFILIAGAALTPFLHYLIKDMPDIPYIHIIYLLYVLDSGISYFYSYKRIFIVSCQDEYISTASQTIRNVAVKLLQILFLVLTHNFIVYLVVQIVCTRVENIVISKIADKMHPFLKDKEVTPLPKEDKAEIKKNVGAMVFHKVGEVIVNTTDNLILSTCMGLNIVGLISNYTLIINSVHTVFQKMMNSMTASVGNLVADSDKDKAMMVFRRVLFLNFAVYFFGFICLTCLLQPFIELWVGADLKVDFAVVIVFAIYFYVSGMRTTVLIFRNAAGLFWRDRYKALVEGIVNLAFSIPLTLMFGAVGVRAGTIISCLGVAFWVEAYVLYKDYFGKGMLRYMVTQLCYLLFCGVCCVGIYYALEYTVWMGGWIGFCIRLVECVILAAVLFCIVFFRNENFKYYFGLMKRILHRGKAGNKEV